MEKYNLVKESNRITPNYDIREEELSIDVYVSHDKELCIIGTIDNNYICWASITQMDNRELNMAILNYIVHGNHDIISNLYKTLGSRYNEVMNWHKFSIHKELHPEGNYLYYSQASNVFLGNDEKYLARFMIGEISTFYNQELLKCKMRLIDDYYKKILERYKNLLKQKKNYDYYIEMKPLIEILENESYLRLCPNEGIRKIYLECLSEASNLYNRYMSVVR